MRQPGRILCATQSMFFLPKAWSLYFTHPHNENIWLLLSFFIVAVLSLVFSDLGEIKTRKLFCKALKSLSTKRRLALNGQKNKRAVQLKSAQRIL
jgi:hypothetical protein